MTRPSRLSLFDLAPDKVLLDRYRILSPHRENGMSAAFRVMDESTSEERELQAFPASLFENSKQADSFGEALRDWAGIQSDAIVSPEEVEAYAEKQDMKMAKAMDDRSCGKRSCECCFTLGGLLGMSTSAKQIVLKKRIFMAEQKLKRLEKTIEKLNQRKDRLSS